MATVEIRDETTIVVTRGAVAAVLSQRSRWATWWPQAEAMVVLDDGLHGMRWALTGTIVGTAEVVLVDQVPSVDQGNAVVVRYRMSVDPAQPGAEGTARVLPDSPHGRREVDELRRRHSIAWKRSMWALKEELESTRRPRGSG